MRNVLSLSATDCGRFDLCIAASNKVTCHFIRRIQGCHLKSFFSRIARHREIDRVGSSRCVLGNPKAYIIVYQELVFCTTVLRGAAMTARAILLSRCTTVTSRGPRRVQRRGLKPTKVLIFKGKYAKCE